MHIFFNVNQINQFYYSNNEASHHHIYVNDTHMEKLNPVQGFIEIEAWLRQHFSCFDKISSVSFGATQLFSTQDPWIGNPAP